MKGVVGVDVAGGGSLLFSRDATPPEAAVAGSVAKLVRRSATGITNPSYQRVSPTYSPSRRHLAVPAAFFSSMYFLASGA